MSPHMMSIAPVAWHAAWSVEFGDVCWGWGHTHGPGRCGAPCSCSPDACWALGGATQHEP